MIVFKTFFKVLKKYKATILLYTIMLIVFGGLNMQTSDNSFEFTAKRPDILIYDKDNSKLSQDLVKYMTDNCDIVDIKNESKEDALFYRDINYILTIPDNYEEEIINNNKPIVEIESTGDYEASYARMLIERYTKLTSTYSKITNNEDEIIDNVNKTISSNVNMKMDSKLDTTSLAKSTFFYNFASYSLMAGAIYVICIILSSFHSEKIKKRTIVSCMDYKKHNRYLLIGCSIFTIVLWLAYVILSYIFVGKVMMTINGLLYIINSFIFSLCCLTIAFLISNISNNKNAINGIINVVALGSSFLCGAFVPAEVLPSTVLKIAHALPTYWYINSNELIKTMDTFNMNTMKPLFINSGVVILFSILFIVLANIISKKNQKIG